MNSHLSKVFRLRAAIQGGLALAVLMLLSGPLSARKASAAF
jgi:hypothetical protein